MEISVNTQSAQPVYEQIIQQIQQGVLSGTLQPKAALPPIRQLAKDLDLNPNTVAKAYQILERINIIVTGGRAGTFIHEDARNRLKESSGVQFAARLRDMVGEYSALGMTKDQIKKIVNDIVQEI